MCVVEGARALAVALEAGAGVEALYVAPGGRESHADLVERASARGAPVRDLAPGVVETVASTVTPQPLLAVVRQPRATLDDLALDGVLVVLADVREPGNAGTVARAAEAAGASAVIFCAGSADPWSPKVVRSSAGALFEVPVVRAGDPEEVLDVLAQRGVRCLGTQARGGEPYDRVDWSPPMALVLGNEARGLGESVTRRVDGWVTIPMAGRADSLNVAMAASVLLFEAARQRQRRQ